MSRNACGCKARRRRGRLLCRHSLGDAWFASALRCTHRVDTALPWGRLGTSWGDRARSGRPDTLGPTLHTGGSSRSRLRTTGRAARTFFSGRALPFVFFRNRNGRLSRLSPALHSRPTPPPSPAVPILSPLCACPHTGTRAGVLTADVLTGAGVRGDVLEDFPSKDLSLNSLALVTR